jgi:hypothetical protein
MSTETTKDPRFERYDRLDLVSLVTEMNDLRIQKESLEAEVKRINEVYDFLRITKIPTVMTDEGIDRISVKGVGRVSITADMHVSIKADKKEAFYTWLRDNGRTDLISETVNPSTLKASVKKMYKDGEIPPEDLLNISPFERASITKE